ncbi:hypothetical protein TNCV_2621461 [Trichonephila clavipes]|uniref:Uncharacterized protein n=1 Tax=Trichonephila clavipes TaxID=2585209 RepID=A0A8X6WCR9_TRICX|nr:hypothetical protein TNCV_2621461 [Trichonephila clavipes]
MLTPNIQPLEDSVLPVCSYHLIGSCLRNSAHHQPPGRNTKPTKYQIEDGGIRPNPVSLYMANIRLESLGIFLLLFKITKTQLLEHKHSSLLLTIN